MRYVSVKSAEQQARGIVFRTRDFFFRKRGACIGEDLFAKMIYAVLNACILWVTAELVKDEVPSRRKKISTQMYFPSKFFDRITIFLCANGRTP